MVLMLSHGVTSFNYDYSSACTRPYRSSRAHNPVTVPCDLNKQSYCNLPGAGYPWHAVRRFVHENQGLMRRMYGDQRHISVLKAEIENNDIDAETQQVPIRDDSYARFSKDRDILNTKFLYSKRPTGRSSGSSYTVPHFRPVQTTPSSSTNKEVNDRPVGAKKKDIPKKSMANRENSSIYKEDIDKSSLDSENIKLAAYKTSFFEDEVALQELVKDNLEMNKIEPEIITLEAAIKQSIETNSVYPNYGVTLKNVTFLPSVSTPQTSEAISTESTTTEYVAAEDTTSPPEYDTDTTTGDSDEENGGWKPVAMDKISTIPPTMLFSQSVKDEITINDRIDLNVEESAKDERIGAGTPSSASISTNLEGQLFQDAVQEEAKPVIKLRGVNACPVKEEVVAPFWANNTRGEVLALLNLYPFEQYVHWEKCTHEHKQMFCREGCRCEQQYRLHRLLAYDPNNECRGIFSDWFRFPSCCVCKCYDMPLEFRVTSRSPRTIEPEIDDSIKKEMYQHAASDWYTINIDE